MSRRYRTVIKSGRWPTTLANHRIGSLEMLALNDLRIANRQSTRDPRNAPTNIYRLLRKRAQSPLGLDHRNAIRAVARR